MMVSRFFRILHIVVGLGVWSACASAPPVVLEQRPRQTFEEKMGWILRLEEDRLVQSPAPPAPPPPVVPEGRRRRVVAPPAPPPRPDLIALLKDDEARIRRRAALAIGRTRLPEAIPALAAVLIGDADPEVRQMAAFAMGLIGQAAAAEALVIGLADADAVVQGRAAEALGLVGYTAGADRIGAMMAGHVASGVLDGIPPDDLEHPKPARVEAVRLGMYALVRLGAYEQLASVLTDGAGHPVSRWWPIAYSFRRIANPKGGPVLMALLQGQGAITRAFAARGLGIIKEKGAIEPLVATLGKDTEVISVRIEAARALADLGASEAVEALVKILTTPKLDPNLRLEAVTALGQIRAPAAVDLFVDLLTETWPTMRAAAFTALARTDAEAFLSVVSGLDPDPHWSVRAALAAAFGGLDRERAQPAVMAMLADGDQRVIPSVLNALIALQASDVETILLERLDADDPVVRLAAANGLARLKSRKAIEALSRAYERAEKDPTYIVRGGILAAVVELDREAAKPLLVRALEDRDWAIRVRAATLMRTVDPSADVSRMRPGPGAVVPELNDLAPMIAPAVSPMAYIDTEKGVIQIELAVLDAPRAVVNFVALARRNFFSATPLHRLVPNFVAQDGDPRGDGEGGPAYTIRDEINQRPYLRGTVGMALDWEDTGGSQFFITHSPQPHLDARYTVFGRVVAGMDVVDRLMQWDQIRSVRIWDGVSWIGSSPP